MVMTTFPCACLNVSSRRQMWMSHFLFTGQCND
jgi:hypothetical protein